MGIILVEETILLLLINKDVYKIMKEGQKILNEYLLNKSEELKLVKEIEKLVKYTPNDQELGTKIRELIKFGNIMGI